LTKGVITVKKVAVLLFAFMFIMLFTACRQGTMPEPSATDTKSTEVTRNDIPFEGYANGTLSDLGYEGVQPPYTNDNGGYTYKISESQYFAFALGEDGAILEATYWNMDCFDSSNPQELPQDDLIYMGCLYSYMIDDMEGYEEFFNSVKLAPEDDLSAEINMAFGGYDISFYDAKIMRNLTITLKTGS
jgi:hypothetical protein